MQRDQLVTTTDKAIFILERTHDGNDLSPHDLKLVEAAANQRITGIGWQALEDLLEKVDAGTYAPQWLHGIEHMRKDHDGYVTWKGAKVEHYSFDDVQAEREAALELADICRSLEDRGFPVTWGNVMRGTFRDAPKGTAWAGAMSRVYTAFSDNQGACWVIFHVSKGGAIAVSHRGGQLRTLFASETPGTSGCYTLYHHLQDMGLDSCARQLDTYAGFTQAMEEAGLSPRLVNELLSRTYDEEQLAA